MNSASGMHYSGHNFNPKASDMGGFFLGYFVSWGWQNRVASETHVLIMKI
jgi:hypothetical protein